MENKNILTEKIIKEVNKAVIGKEDIVKKVLTSILAKGHILIEDIPGVGKTTLALAFSKVMGLQCKRLQFTSDVLPSDITGFSVYNKKTETFTYKEGVIMCNLFLADEINRTSSKTQSALLEVMEEGKITVDGITRKVPNPFIVIATENLVGSIGTNMLPESQLDRFMIKTIMGYPKIDDEINILKSKQNKKNLDEITEIVSIRQIVEMQKEVDSIFIHDDIYRYIVELIAATRKSNYITLGVSPRGTIALTKMSKAVAYMNGRNYVIPEDVLEVFEDVIAHRIIINQKAKMNKYTENEIANEIISHVKVPELVVVTK